MRKHWISCEGETSAGNFLMEQQCPIFLLAARYRSTCTVNENRNGKCGDEFMFVWYEDKRKYAFENHTHIVPLANE